MAKPERLTAVLFFAAACAVLAEGTAVNLDFEKDATGKPPADFRFAVTGDGGPSEWVVKEDATAPSGKKVVAQTSADSADYRFPLCVHDGVTAKDVDAFVRFKAVSGKVDQAAGLVARYADRDNYYVTRANALEDNVRLYKVEKGQRRQFAGVNTPVAPGQWHSLRLEVKGKHFRVSMDEKLLFEADDETFSAAGKVGLWTKADSVTYFDDLRITPSE
ncbi:MAG: hypothetical protein HYZ53_27060 [Planctomycetes bacterium]|nr:hypothetical protein [Planctomycetota bacterium]